MARENETYRLELEQLMLHFPGKHVLTRTELMEYLGKNRTWLDNHGFAGKDFTIVWVASKLSKGFNA